MSGAAGVLGGPPQQKQDPQKELGSLRPDTEGWLSSFFILDYYKNDLEHCRSVFLHAFDFVFSSI